jgi:hypothetical protein
MPTPRRYASHAERQAAYRRRVAAARQHELQAKGMPSLPRVPNLPGTRRWAAMTEQALVLLQTIQEEMEEYHEQRSQQWQESERGEAMGERLQALQEVIAAVEGLSP